MITIIHFHLINPIMLGSKKTKDVQFYSEVREGARRAKRCFPASLCHTHTHRVIFEHILKPFCVLPFSLRTSFPTRSVMCIDHL
jgi:hypothetical protein